ncbi:hypothetical protein CPC08DRAFT_710983 [Agrocybe pediades]|nr:hypothetical protein CPC08DRAFT_710983 [Agrocybe pediades]
MASKLNPPRWIPNTLRLASHENARDKAVATGHLDPGSSILKTPAFAAILLDSEKGRRCDHCFRKNAGLKKCTGCGSYWYCDAHCQAAQWQPHHKRLCKAFNSYTSSTAFQALQRHEKYDSILLSHVLAHISLLPDAYASEDMMYSVLLSLLPGPQHPSNTARHLPICPIRPPPPPDILRKIYARFGNNNFAIHSHLTSIGHGVFPIASRLFNHSCVPNAAAKYILSPTGSVTMDVVALRIITPGEEICLPYLDPGLLQTREQILELSYGFKCDCVSCFFLRKIGPLPEIPEDEKDLSSLEEQLTSFANISSISGLKLPNPSIEKTPSVLHCLLRESYMTKLSETFSEASHEQKYDVALKSGLTLLSLYLLVYPENYPQIGMHLLELAKTAWNATISASSDRIPQEMRKRVEVFLTLAFQVLTILGDEGDSDGPMEEITLLGGLLAAET